MVVKGLRGYRPNRSGGPWTRFFVAVLFLLLFLLLFPLFPLGAELLFTQQITMASLMLMTATYATSLSMSSQHVGRWAVGLLMGLMFSTLFGWCMGRGDGSMGAAFRLQPGPAAHPGWFWFSLLGIGSMFAVHVYERSRRHVTNGDPFPEFLGGERWSP